MTKKQREPLSRDEMIEILEDIARNQSNRAAQIAAIKQLESMRDGNEAPEGDFAALDRGSLKRARRRVA